MYEKHNPQTNTIESNLNIHERYWAFFQKFPMQDYLLDFDFGTQDLKNDQTILICTAKLLDRSDDKVLLKTVSSIDINIEHAWQYVESYAAARLFNRLGIDAIIDKKPATDESVKALATQKPTSTPTQNADDSVDLDLPEIGELIPNEPSAEQANHAVEPESDEASSKSEPESSVEEPAQEETQSVADTTDNSESESADAESDTKQSVSTEAKDTKAEESTVNAEPEAEVNSETQSEPVAEIEETNEVDSQVEDVTVESKVEAPQPSSEESCVEYALESDSQDEDDITAQSEEAQAILDEQMMEELQDSEESTDIVESAELDPQVNVDSEPLLNESDLKEVSIALPTADMFGQSPVNADADTQTETEVEVEQTFEILDQLDTTDIDTSEAPAAEKVEPQVESNYDETNHPQDVPGTIWGNVVAAVKANFGNDWKLHLPNNMEEAIVILQSN